MDNTIKFLVVYANMIDNLVALLPTIFFSDLQSDQELLEEELRRTQEAGEGPPSPPPKLAGDTMFEEQVSGMTYLVLEI